MARNDRIEITRVSGALGAEVTGVDLSRSLDAETVGLLRAAWLEHQVLFYPGQTLGDADLERFTSYFGPFGQEPFVDGISTEHPNVLAVIKEADETRKANFGGNWHSDWSFQEAPPAGTFLYALDVPPHGGDTMWANQYLAYETLSPGMQRLLDGLAAMHSARRPYGRRGIYADKSQARSMKIRTGIEAEEEIAHPVVRVHPETGRKALYVNQVYTIRFKDMTARESAPLLEYLHRHATQPEFVCRRSWSRGMLAMWDNRCTQHYAVNDYDGFRRELHRTTCAGDVPAGPHQQQKPVAAQ
ncbi:MAG: TauD/TfdA dioxygenase family protein [Reyranellaceae bacterium]